MLYYSVGYMEVLDNAPPIIFLCERCIKVVIGLSKSILLNFLHLTFSYNQSNQKQFTSGHMSYRKVITISKLHFLCTKLPIANMALTWRFIRLNVHQMQCFYLLKQRFWHNYPLNCTQQTSTHRWCNVENTE